MLSELPSVCLIPHADAPQSAVKFDNFLWYAAFVTCSAAGMALGPLLAVPMARVPTVQIGPLTFNPITAGAWVMSLIWLVFLAVTMLFFQEPPVRYDHQLTILSLSCRVALQPSAPLLAAAICNVYVVGLQTCSNLNFKEAL